VQKDVVWTIGGVLATSAAVFGGGLLVVSTFLGGGSTTTLPPPTEPPTGEHSASADISAKAPAAEPHAAAGAASAAKPEIPALKDVNASDLLDQFQGRYNDLVARGNYDEARLTATKAMAVSAQFNPAWSRRLADATFRSENLPEQQRYGKAYERYAALLAATDAYSLDHNEREWLQYRASLCLWQLKRWDDAVEAGTTFLKAYPHSQHRHEIRLVLAYGKLVRGQRAEARTEVVDILAENPPEEIRAKALLALAQIDRELAIEASNPAAPAPLGEIVPDGTVQPTPAVPPGPQGIPPSEWARINNAVQNGRIADAERLLAPWTDANSPLTDTLRAQLTMRFAKMLREQSTSERLAP
jgi:tetratricopeptide (TPR) repeat protein